MSIKLKALGLGLLAAMAMASVAAVNAGATASGHFTSTASHTNITGTENTTHQVKLSVDGGTTIECKKTSYSGTIAAATATEITITPSYAECQTTGGTANAVTVTMNGCDYVFFSQGTRTHGTATVVCPVGKAIEIHHPNCTITVGTSHALGGGIDYDQDGAGLTANVTVTEVPAEYHGGACIFLGTNHKGTMTGSATISGKDKTGTTVTLSST
ncbi:MAG TPA: hypothetical protein VGB06_06760 [Solirubrobacterales bacterium]|jgi:hypothetical protein